MRTNEQQLGEAVAGIVAVIAEMERDSADGVDTGPVRVGNWARTLRVRLAALSSHLQVQGEALKAAQEYLADDRHDYIACRRLLHNLVAVLPSGDPQEQWRPIESAPNTNREGDWSHVLISVDDHALEAYWDTDAECWVRANLMVTDEDAIVYSPTHWMPLPAPPLARSPQEEP